MDENSCVDETSKSVENAVKGQEKNNSEATLDLVKVGTAVEGKAGQSKVPSRRGSSCDTSGPSTGICTSEILGSENKNNAVTEPAQVDKPVEPSVTVEESEPVAAEPPTAAEETAREQPLALVQESPEIIRPDHEDDQSVQPQVRVDPCLNEPRTTRKLSIGPPPSYSFVMKQKKKLKSLPSPDPSVINRPPPPNYTNSRDLFGSSPERIERIYNFPSFMEPVWRAHSQPALCTRCGVIVLTKTHSHDSVATHIAAMALCLFGCWPCCLLPYCMNVCKNIYHYCPICQAYLGLYTPCDDSAVKVFSNRTSNVYLNSRRY